MYRSNASFLVRFICVSLLQYVPVLCPRSSIAPWHGAFGHEPLIVLPQSESCRKGQNIGGVPAGRLICPQSLMFSRHNAR
jgi:hypothetical protein